MEKIYVRLLDEGIDVWRPVLASRIPNTDQYYIEKEPINIVPKLEQWEFLPGTNVEVVESLSDSEIIKKIVREI